MVQKTNSEKTTDKKVINPTTEAQNSQRKRGQGLMIGGFLLLAFACFMGTLINNTEVTIDETEEEEIVANCSATECLAKIETTDSPEKITEVVGVEPDGGEDGEYKWKISSKESIAREKSGDSYILQATIDKEKLVNEKLDFSVFSELKQQLGKGESFSYDELVKKFNGVEGTLAGKTGTSKRYIWVDDHDQTFGATFSNKDGQCSIITLR